MFETPILFMVFNRPVQTQRVFDRIRELKPSHLYVVADGPRAGRVDDVENCRDVRVIIENGIDWHCTVRKLFRDENLGCGHGVSQGINWFFSQVEQGIILEDDCLPNLSFFDFCEQLLLRYAEDERVMSICGSNFQFGKKRGKASYYFSHNSHVWGWATWKRAWKYYNFDMPDIESGLASRVILNRLDDAEETVFWTKVLSDVREKKDTWDYQWQYAIWENSGLVIYPNVNLVENLGFGLNATHTKQLESRLSEMSTKSFTKMVHPTNVVRDKRADKRFFKMVHMLRPHASFVHRIELKLQKIFDK